MSAIRQSILGWFLLIVLSGCSGSPVEPEPPPRPNPQPPSTQPIQGVGCFLQGVSGAATNLQALMASGQVFYPSGNIQLDAFNQQEGLNLVNTFFLSPRMFYLHDASPNAYATPEVANSLGPDGTILFGRNLTVQQLARDPSGASLVAIMAHEFAHLAQFKGGFREPGKRPELHADFMAGWYLSLRGRYSWVNLMPTLRVFFEIGDYNFNSPAHHGTPQERLTAAQAGFSSGASTASQAYALGWQFVR